MLRSRRAVPRACAAEKAASEKAVAEKAAFMKAVSEKAAEKAAAGKTAVAQVVAGKVPGKRFGMDLGQHAQTIPNQDELNFKLNH